jgi:hypothetical protein
MALITPPGATNDLIGPQLRTFTSNASILKAMMRVIIGYAGNEIARYRNGYYLYTWYVDKLQNKLNSFS